MYVVNIGDNYYEKTYYFLVDIAILITIGRVYCKCYKYSSLIYHIQKK